MRVVSRTTSVIIVCVWIYTANALRQRLRMPAAHGYWLDYWLFLHAEQTSRLWSARPLGLRTLADTAVLLTRDEDRSLRNQLLEELSAASKLSSISAVFPPVPLSPALSSNVWTAEWRAWLTRLRELGESESLITELTSELATVLDTGRYIEAAFITRRLAAELSERGWSSRQMRKVALAQFCSAKDDAAWSVDRFSADLRHAFGSRAEEPYWVTIPVAAVRVPVAVAKQPRMITSPTEDGAVELTALRIRMWGTHSDHAVTKAIDNGRRLLEHLRLVYYVNTHIRGEVVVAQSDDGKQYLSPVPQPFWTKRLGLVRPLPRVPARTNEALAMMTPASKSIWRATEWHVSQAVAAWAEALTLRPPMCGKR